MVIPRQITVMLTVLAMNRSEMAKVAVKDAAADADEDEGAHEPPQKKHLLKQTASRRAMKMIKPSQKPLSQVVHPQSPETSPPRN